MGLRVVRRTRRLWSDDEKRWNCLQTTAPDVSVAQVARRYGLNANLIIKWVRDPWFAPGAALSGDEAEELEAIYEITPAQLDDIAPPGTYAAEWRDRNNPTLNAFNFLDDLDLGPEDEEGDDLRGDLLFIEGEHPGSTYIAVEAPDELALHLLQARLLDLGENVYIRIERSA
jgi:hypothetical protein